LFADFGRFERFAKASGSQNREALLWEIVKQWVEIEKLATIALSQSHKERSITPVDAINWIRSSSLLSDAERGVLNEILTIRNRQVHSKGRIEKSLNELQSIRDIGYGIIGVLGKRTARIKPK
jgi:hypothetical protein